jgi:hypothetical protein
VESTSGAIQLIEEHWKQGIFERRVSISACLRVWKHGMRCHNENESGIFFYLPYHGAPEDSYTHQVVIFNDTSAL